MEAIYEISKAILPAIIAGIFTFFITKYTYSNNKPIEKLELAYNRVYYPIYKIVTNRNEKLDIENNKIKIRKYLIKYDKYIDISTKRLFESLCKCNKEAKKKSLYQNFVSNIFNKNSYLRRRLGYLEPNIAEMYKYSTPSARSLFRIIIEFSLICIAFSLGVLFEGIKNKVYFNISIYFSVICFYLLIIEAIWCLLRFIYYKIMG